MPSVAIVLPPREAFSEESGGAVASVVRSHARFGEWPTIVVGRPVSQPFEGVAFRAVIPGWWRARAGLRYAAGVAVVLHAEPSTLIEVHNRPEVALFLARRFAGVRLFLHNDPRGMRQAHTAAQRIRLSQRVLGIVAVSTWVAERFETARNVAVLPNGIDLASLTGANQRDPSILFVGRVVADKGADLFVAAARRFLPELPNWHATIIGADRFGAASPDTPYLRQLRPEAAEAGVAMNGWRTHAEVMAAMARAAIVVVPGRWPEPFGLVALEAMAAGAALVFVPNGGLTELVGDAGLPVAAEAAAIAEAVLALARDPARRAALAAAGRARARDFDIRVVVARLDAQRRAALVASPPAPICALL